MVETHLYHELWARHCTTMTWLWTPTTFIPKTKFISNCQEWQTLPAVARTKIAPDQCPLDDNLTNWPCCFNLFFKNKCFDYSMAKKTVLYQLVCFWESYPCHAPGLFTTIRHNFLFCLSSLYDPSDDEGRDWTYPCLPLFSVPVTPNNRKSDVAYRVFCGPSHITRLGTERCKTSGGDLICL
jgi:hypothetical protein